MEFKHVFLIGMADEVFPSYQATKKGPQSKEMEEERRNCLVAITRAEETLNISWSRAYNGYAQEIGWSFVSREEAERRRGFDPEVPPADRAKNRSLFFDDLLDAKVREFNPRYAEAEGALLGKLRHLHTDIYGNREFVEHLPNRGKFFDHEEKRERDLILIDYDDPARNVYEVTEEWAFHNGHYGTREDVVFLIRKVIQRGGIGKKRRSAKG